MARPPAPRTGVYIRSGPSVQVAPTQDNKSGEARKAWPFAEGSQNHLDETSAPWPRPSRPASGKPSGKSKPDQ